MPLNGGKFIIPKLYWLLSLNLTSLNTFLKQKCYHFVILIQFCKKIYLGESEQKLLLFVYCFQWEKSLWEINLLVGVYKRHRRLSIELHLQKNVLYHLYMFIDEIPQLKTFFMCQNCILWRQNLNFYVLLDNSQGSSSWWKLVKNL